MIDASRRQFQLRQLFWLTAIVALTLGVWLPSVDELSRSHEVAAILMVLVRLAIGCVALMAVARHIRLMPGFVRRLPLELQVLTGLAALLVVLIAAAILLPPID
jgi:hypothetical protein